MSREVARHWQHPGLPGIDLLRARYVTHTFAKHTAQRLSAGAQERTRFAHDGAATFSRVTRQQGPGRVGKERQGTGRPEAAWPTGEERDGAANRQAGGGAQAGLMRLRPLLALPRWLALGGAHLVVDETTAVTLAQPGRRSVLVLRSWRSWRRRWP